LSQIYLREILREDLPIINRWRADNQLVNLLGTAFRYVGIEVDSKWFDSYLETRQNNIRLAICLTEQDKLLGGVYLLGIDWVNRSAEFAIQIGEQEEQGKGIGELATQMVVRHAFNDLNLYRLHLNVLATNSRAIKLYHKVGFIEEGLLRHAVYKNGVPHDLIIMALLKNECDFV